MQFQLPLEETAGIMSGCHITVGSNLTKWVELLSFLGAERVSYSFFLSPGLRSVPDVQWMFQKCFISQLKMKNPSQTPIQVGNISSTCLIYCHVASNRFRDSELCFS